MKKAFALVSALTLAAGTAVGLAACEETPADDTPEAHTHTYGEWTVETPATLFTAGSEYRVCTADDCDAEDKGREEQAIPALGTTSAVADAFVTYNDGVSKTDTGAMMGLSTEGPGASTYFGEEDKVMEFDGANETSISFTLDLSTMEVGDYTVFSLAFGVEDTVEDGQTTSGHRNEAMVGILKTETGYTVAGFHNALYENYRGTTTQAQADEGNIAAINGSEKKVTVTGDTITLTYTYSYDADATDYKLNVSLSVNGEKAFDYDGMSNRNAEIKGARYLWNISTNVETVVLSNLVKE